MDLYNILLNEALELYLNSSSALSFDEWLTLNNLAK